MISDLGPSKCVAVEFLHGVRVVCGGGGFEPGCPALWPGLGSSCGFERDSASHQLYLVWGSSRCVSQGDAAVCESRNAVNVALLDAEYIGIIRNCFKPG